MKKLEAPGLSGAAASLALLFGVVSCNEPAHEPPAPHVQRVSLDTFRAENPQLAGTDFSGIGELRFNGETTCTAFLIEGGIIVTAQHCLESAYVYFTLGGTNGVYSFHATGTDGQPVTLRLLDGTPQSLRDNIFFPDQLDIRGRSTNNKDNVVSERFLNFIQHDVLFFRLSTPPPETLTPLEVATENDLTSTEPIRNIYALGFSPFHYQHLSLPEWRALSAARSPTITRHSCSAHPEQSVPEILVSTCLARPGDSGGPLFQIMPDNRLRVFGVLNATLLPHPDTQRDFLDLYNSLSMPLDPRYMHFAGYTFSRTLSDFDHPCDNRRSPVGRRDPCRLFDANPP